MTGNKIFYLLQAGSEARYMAGQAADLNAYLSLQETLDEPHLVACRVETLSQPEVLLARLGVEAEGQWLALDEAALAGWQRQIDAYIAEERA